MLAAMCTATFMLAEADLLGGTEHHALGLCRAVSPACTRMRCWMSGRSSARTIALISSGGASAAVDLLLHLVRRFASLELAQLCSRYLLIDNVRSEQSSYVLWSMPSHGDARHPAGAELAGRALRPGAADRRAGRPLRFRRTQFQAALQEATGYTPLAYLQTLRLEKAKQLLETTRMSLDSITFAVGYEDSNSFRRLFQQRVLLPAALPQEVPGPRRLSALAQALACLSVSAIMKASSSDWSAFMRGSQCVW